MLLKNLKATNSRGTTLDLPLQNPSGGFVVKNIDGLGPVQATLVSSSFADRDGERYHTSRRVPRNIVVQLGLDPDYSQMNVYDLRNELYQYFMPKTAVQLDFHLFDKFSSSVIDQNLDVEIKGRVESLEPNMFTKDPTVDLSVMCYDPNFVDPTEVIFEGMTVSDLTETTLDYEGTTETGVLFTILPDRLLEDFTIYQKTPDDKLKTVYYTDVLNGAEVLEISSVRGDKYVRRTAGGVESSTLFALSPQSAWLELEPGPNIFRVYASGAPVPYKIEYTKKYGGL